MTADPIDIRAVRRHFAFPRHGRVVTNNAASTQPPRELLALYQSLAPGYENVHRGQSTASQAMTARVENVTALSDGIVDARFAALLDTLSQLPVPDEFDPDEPPALPAPLEDAAE